MAGPWIGVDLGGTKMLCVATWADGRPRSTLHLATGADTFGEQIEHYIERFARSLDERPQGIGIAVPGLVENGRVVASDVLPQLDGWSPRGFADGLSPAVLNDVRAALTGQLEGDDAHATMAVIMVGTGIGMACAAGGRVVEGARGWAGELGSMPMRAPDGIVKLDALASGAAIVARSRRDPGAIHTVLAAGDAEVQRTIAEAGEAFGLALATVVDILNPSLVVLGGGTLRYDGYVARALAVAAEHALPQLWEACTIVDRSSDALIVALGAARAAELAQEED